MDSDVSECENNDTDDLHEEDNLAEVEQFYDAESPTLDIEDNNIQHMILLYGNLVECQQFLILIFLGKWAHSCHE